MVKNFNGRDVGKVVRSVVRIEQKVTDSSWRNVDLKNIGRNWFTNRVVDDWNRLSH